MSEDGFKNISGRFKDSNPLPIDNPEMRPKVDWWDELCKAHGAENHWSKDKKNKTDEEDK
jgi:hypothetical protein